MKNSAFKYVLVISLLLLLVVAFSAAAEGPTPVFVPAQGSPAAGTGILIQEKGVSGDGIYIIRLVDPPLASYKGGVNGLAATSPTVTGAAKLDVNSAESVSYLDYLAGQQARFLTAASAAIGRSLDPIYQYNVVTNGFAAKMSPQEAAAVAKIPGVAAVERDVPNQIQTDVTPDFIGATKIWDGSANGGVGIKGEGVIVGVLDTGIWPEHPSFADDGSYPPPPAGWSGSCSTPDDGTAPYTCNNKLIGAKHFLDTYIVAEGGYDGLFISARDDGGHGTHTASTAAGNEGVDAVLLGVDRGKISGIAPRAYVAMYKVCGPGGCYNADTAAALDEAVADGVDVINYSIGGGASDPWSDTNSLAFLNARDAGVFVATSAGNSGPDAETLGSPGDAPWITTVGASTSNRYFISDITLSGGDSPPTGLWGVTLTDGVTNFKLVDAEGIADEEGDDRGLCVNPYPAGTFKSNEVVLCKRGEVARVVRGEYVKAGGGGGVILYNAVPDQGLSTDNFEIPAVHVVLETGLEIKAFITANPGTAKVTFTEGQAVMDNDPRVISDMMADFSSRGSNPSVPSVIKPDVTAPGVQVLAGNTPECLDPAQNACGAPGELFQAISGTSMSSPHVAGAGALVKAAHPDWTPGQIQSALMTTALTSVVKEDGTTPADPFDMGAGRIDLTQAALAPLTLDETTANFEDADPAGGGDPKDLNLPSLGNTNCVVSCSWERTVTNVTSGMMTWDGAVTGLEGSVTPASFTLDAGESQTVVVEVSAVGLENGTWAFGQVELTPQGGGTAAAMPPTHMPVAIVPNTGDIPSYAVIPARRDAGSYLLQDLQAIEITEMTITAHGAVPGKETHFWTEEDPTNDIGDGGMYDDLDQVFWKTIPVAANSARLVNEILQTESPDLDMAVGFDSNGNGKPDADEEVCLSATAATLEYCNVAMPEKGTWWVLVMNYQSADSGTTDHSVLATAVVPMADKGNLTFDAPESVPELDPFDIRINYVLENSYPGQAWYGAMSVGSDPAHKGNVAEVNIDIYRLADDVEKSTDTQSALPGDEVTFTITVNENYLNEEVKYKIVDMIPDGLTYVPDSAEASSGDVMVVGNKLTWDGTMANPFALEPTYNITTSANDPMCDTGFGGYVNLADFGINTQSAVSGDTVAFSFFNSGNPINYYGLLYQGMIISDDGLAIFDANNFAGKPWEPQLIPNPAFPNNTAAMLWQDMEIIYDQATNRGISAATAGDNLMIVEYDDIQLFEDDANQYDFEIVMTRAVDNTPGAYEIVYAYDNLDGTLDGPLTIGVENPGGQAAVALVNQASAAGVLSDGFMVCFDAVAPTIDPITITYKVTVDANVPLGKVLMNKAVSTTSTVGSAEETASAGLYIGYPFFNPIIPIKN